MRVKQTGEAEPTGNNSTKKRKQRTPPTVAVTVRLEGELAEWGKQQKGGLSALLRRLLRQERKRRERANEAKQGREQTEAQA